MVTHRYIEPNIGNDTWDGTQPTVGGGLVGPWATVKHAEEVGVLAADTNVWGRRTINEIPAGPADIACAYDGGAGTPIQLIGWPRGEEGAGSGVWANGSTEINDVAGLEMSREKHAGRRVKQDTDGHWYLITYIPYIRQDAGAIKLAFVNSNPDTITDTDARFVKQDIKAGDKIRITGSTSNDGTYTIAGVVAGTITLIGGDTLNAENAIDGTKIQVYDRFIIDREYAGSDTGAFTIQKDDDYDTRPAAGTAAGWDGDADDLPIIDFNDGIFNLNLIDDYYNIIKNVEIKDSADANGIVSISSCRAFSIIGCLLKQTAASRSLLKSLNVYVYVERCIFEGSGAGATQRGIEGDAVVKDSAFYNLGNSAFYRHRYLFLENVNCGVEQINGAAEFDIYIGSYSKAEGRDVKLNGTNGYITYSYPTPWMMMQFENYNKVLGAHKSWFIGGTKEKVAADGGGNRPNQRSGGNANVIEVIPNVANFEFIPDWAVPVFRHEYVVGTTQRTWRYYVQNNGCGVLSATQLWMKLEYVDDYDDTSEYHITEVLSDETVANRANNNDWTQYIEVPNITPAVIGDDSPNVRVTIYISKNCANEIYIDPQVVNP